MISFLAKLVRKSALCVFGVAALVCTSATGAPTEVRWSQWKTTEVGEKFMAEFKAAFGDVSCPSDRH